VSQLKTIEEKVDNISSKIAPTGTPSRYAYSPTYPNNDPK
jgi:hypothetical protein